MQIPFPTKRSASHAIRRLSHIAMALATLLTCVAAAVPLDLCSCECCVLTNADGSAESSCCCCTVAVESMAAVTNACECCNAGRCDCDIDRPQQSPLIERRHNADDDECGPAILPHAIYETRPTSLAIVSCDDTPPGSPLRTHALCSVWLN